MVVHIEMVGRVGVVLYSKRGTHLPSLRDSRFRSVRYLGLTSKAIAFRCSATGDLIAWSRWVRVGGYRKTAVGAGA